MLSEREQQHVKRIAKKHRSRAKIVNAESIPARDTDDAYGNPFLGIPSNRLKEFDITATEQADDSTTLRVLASDPHGVDPLGTANQNADVNRAVNGDVIRTKTIDGYHAKDNAFGSRVIAGVDAGVLIGNVPLANIPDIPAGKLPDLVGLNGDLPLSRTTGGLGPGRVPSLAKLHGKVKAHSQIDWGNKPSVPPSAVGDGYDYRRLDHKPSLKKFLTRADFRADGTLKR